MAMTVGQLVEIPTLRTRLIAGGSGIDREILWAHSCELPQPWEWLGPGDLLMTTGTSFPDREDGQCAFIAALSDAGISGLALAEGMGAAAVTAAAVQAAERLRFPILVTAYDVPFVALARTVGASGQSGAQARFNRVMRVYDAYRAAVQNGVADQHVLRHLSVELGHPLHVVDARTGRTVVGSGSLLPADLGQQIQQLVASSPALPATTRLKTAEGQFMLLPVRTHPDWVMVADVTGGRLDIVVLQHVNTIVTIEAERRRAEMQTRLAVAGRLMAHLIAGDVDSELVKDRLAEFNLDRGPWQIVTAWSDPLVRTHEIQAALQDHGLPGLVHVRESAVVVLTDANPAAIAAIDAAVGPAGQLGVSLPVQRISGIADAVRQAEWAREACGPGGGRVVRYGRDRPLFLPGTVAEAEGIVRTVLGAVIDYDERQGTNLLDSLAVFFEENRSWQGASNRLGVHKQTLVYRIRRVAELTQRRLDNLDDIAELHLALRARRHLHQG